MNLISLINQRIEKDKISIAKLAGIVGVSPSTLHRHLDGITKKMSTDLEFKLRDALNISVSDVNEYLQGEVERNRIMNMDIVETNRESQCNTCLKYGTDVKEMQLGQSNQITSINLCTSCRKKLIYKLLESLNVFN